MVGRSARFNHLTSKKHEWTPARRRTLSCLLVSLLLFSWPLLSYLRCHAATQPSSLSHSSLLLLSFSFHFIPLSFSLKPWEFTFVSLSLSSLSYRSFHPCPDGFSRSDIPLVSKEIRSTLHWKIVCNLLLKDCYKYTHIYIYKICWYYLKSNIQYYPSFHDIFRKSSRVF